MIDIILLGAGGHAKSIIDSIEQLGIYNIVGFLDMPPKKNFVYKSYSVIGEDNDLEKLYASGVHHAFITIGFMGDQIIRNNLYKELKEIGYVLPTIIDPTAVIASDVRLGEGTFLGKRSVVNSNARIGNMCIINTNAVIEHDCHIGDFSHVAVNAVICGETIIGSSVLVGASATVIQGIKIGNNTSIGAGTNIIKSVEDNMVIYNQLNLMAKKKSTGGGAIT